MTEVRVAVPVTPRETHLENVPAAVGNRHCSSGYQVGATTRTSLYQRLARCKCQPEGAGCRMSGTGGKQKHRSQPWTRLGMGSAVLLIVPP